MKLVDALNQLRWLVESFADSGDVPMRWLDENPEEYEDAWQDYIADDVEIQYYIAEVTK